MSMLKMGRTPINLNSSFVRSTRTDSDCESFFYLALQCHCKCKNSSLTTVFAKLALRRAQNHRGGDACLLPQSTSAASRGGLRGRGTKVHQRGRGWELPPSAVAERGKRPGPTTSRGHRERKAAGTRHLPRSSLVAASGGLPRQPKSFHGHRARKEPRVVSSVIPHSSDSQFLKYSGKRVIFAFTWHHRAKSKRKSSDCHPCNEAMIGNQTIQFEGSARLAFLLLFKSAYIFFLYS